MKFNKILSIETSCDDTSVAVVGSEGLVYSCLSANQDTVHRLFGGVVPEIASRNHSLNILPLVEECLKQAGVSWQDLDGIAVTARPGLVGALMVGVVTAKALALAFDLPFIGINHLEGHLLAPFLQDEQFTPVSSLKYPYLALAISGGHTQICRVDGLGLYHVMGQTVDDAAGEAFDKMAKMLGLGFPGGILVDQTAKGGDRKFHQFPRPLIHEDHFDMSFSGLKTAALRYIESQPPEFIKSHLSDICASYQEAIVDVLIAKLDRAVDYSQLGTVVLTGGVSANSRLRERGQKWADRRKVQLVIPPLRYCTDNAAMIGYAGILRFNRGEQSEDHLGPSPSNLPGDFIFSENLK